MNVMMIGDTEFEQEVLRSEIPVLVDLFAEWCAPCKQMAPLLDELAAKHAGKLKVVKVDIEKSPMIAQSFRVQSVPMLVVVAGGQLVGHHAGALDMAGLEGLVAPALPRDAQELDPKEVKALIDTGRILAVDIRDASSYGRYRLPGAIHIPKDELESRKAELAPTDGRVRIIYGRGKEDTEAGRDEIKRLGLEVGFMTGGFLNWEVEGFDVDRG